MRMVQYEVTLKLTVDSDLHGEPHLWDWDVLLAMQEPESVELETTREITTQ